LSIDVHRNYEWTSFSTGHSLATLPEADIDGRHVHTIRMLASRWGEVILELGRLRSKTVHGCGDEILPIAQQCR
jgi:hypothetical protein